MTAQRDDALLALINSACNDTATAEQVDQLERSLRSDPAACRVYLRYLTLDSEMHYLCRVDSADRLARHRVDSPSPIPPIVVQSLPSAISPLQSFIGSALFSYAIAALIVGLGLIIGAYVYVSQPQDYVGPRSPVRTPNPQSPIPNPSPRVARITGMVDCEWDNDECRMRNAELRMQNADIHHSSFIIHHSPIHLGDRLALRSGLIELTYATGARVILQGPVTYDVESPSGGYLAIGKLTAKLEKKSEVRGQRSETANQRSDILDHQFAVRTPTAIVTDLGTEFGVEVDGRGSTTSRVFRGSVSVRSVSGDKPNAATRVMHENESIRVEKAPGNSQPAIVPLSNAKLAFVRSMPKPAVSSIDLADVVAGGDGAGGKRGRGIDPSTGRIVASPAVKSKRLVGDGRYRRVRGLPFVDGVFIPCRDRGPVEVDSARHTFDWFGNAAGETWNAVWAGEPVLADNPRQPASAVLGNSDYGSTGHGLLYMHANKGVTFDLDAIRRAYPEQRIVRFNAVVGNAETPAVALPACPAKTLLAQDFQAIPPGDVQRTAPFASSDRSSPGVLLAANRVTAAQIVAQAEGKPGAAPGNSHLVVRGGWMLANDWAPADTEDRIVQVSVSVLVSSESGSDAIVHAFPDPALYKQDYAFAVSLAAGGAVAYFNGRETVHTNLVSRPDVWQHLVITANMAAHTFSVKLDDQPLFRDGFWLGGGRRVDHLLIGSNVPQGAVSFDNLAFSVQPPAAYRGHEPERKSADVWVLIDGERRAGRRDFRRSGGSYSLSVPIADQNRFLTLAVTDRGDALFWDSILFGDPRLEMAPIATQQPSHDSTDNP